MSKTFDELMKVLEEKGSLAEEDGKRVIEQHGPLTDDEKKNLAAAIKMRKALTGGGSKNGPTAEAKNGEKKDEGEKMPEATKEEVSMDAYLQALSDLDSDSASAQEKEKAKATKEKFESQ